MKEVNKENDIFVSTLLNPEADVQDLLANNINVNNTGLLSKDDYKNSKFVKQQFTDQNGIFNNELFEQVYDIAKTRYNELDSIKTYDDLNNLIKYDPNDIYAPVQSEKDTPKYEIQKVRNPFRVSEGVTSLFGKGESNKSMRELAQMHKVWDSENEKWLDYTAEDQGFLGLKYLGRPALVYATWDEDGTHFDKSLGREVQHRKGEWKTDDNGEFYTETAGNKQQYGKEFVAYSDILTKEDSWANKFDFFDSDDKKKSITGTVMKGIAAVAPYMIPVVREVYGGITAAVTMASVFPTFAKAAEGLILGDDETAFTKGMNTMENYFSKFSHSNSDAGRENMINFETICDTVSDVFGQLYQMRAASSLSKLYTKQFTKAQQESAKKFSENFGAAWAKAAIENPKEFSKDANSFKKLWESLVENTPEMKEIIAKQSKLSKSLSLGYMALTTSADVYKDAIEGGYDRRMAGLATFLATAGQYGIMMNNKMGDWFLDATTGYKEGVSRNIMRKTLQPYYEEIKEAADKLVSPIEKEAKSKVLANIFTKIFKDGPKNFYNLIKYGGEEFWKRSIIEGVEEVTEEAVMDATKGVIDLMSAAGIGKNAGTASFGGLDNTFSVEGAQRYLMNFIGGAIGGALFEFQGKVWQPFIDNVILHKTSPEVRYSIIQEIMNGNTNELMAEIDRMTADDKAPITLQQQGSEGEGKTRGQVINDSLKSYVRFVQGIVTEAGIPLDKLSDPELLKKVVRTKLLEPVIESSGIMKMISGDFTKMVDDFVKLNSDYTEKFGKIEVEEKDNKKKEGESKKEDSIPNTVEKQELEKQIEEKKKELLDFLNGGKELDYLKTALIYLHPVMRNAALGVDKYSYTQAKYGKDYSTLPDTDSTLSKSKIDQEYAEWKDKANDLQKFRTVGVFAYDQMQKDFSSTLQEYAESQYKDVRKHTFDEVLRDINFDLGELIKDENWKNTLFKWAEALNQAKLPGINLEDKLQIGKETKQEIVDSLSEHNEQFINAITEELNKVRKPEDPELTKEDVKKEFKANLFAQIENVPLENLSPKMLDNFVAIANNNFASILTKRIFDNLGEVDAKTAKNAVDSELLNMGYSPIQGEFQGADIQIEAMKYINMATAPKTSFDSNINLAKSYLKEYINSHDIIDNEVFRKIKQSLYHEILGSYQDIFAVINGDEFSPIETADEELAEFTFKNLNINIPTLEVKAKHGLENNMSAEEIAEDYLFSEDGVMDIHSPEFENYIKEVPDAKEKAIKLVAEILKKLPSYEVYEVAKSKKSSANPLFEKLRSFGMKVFDGDDMKLFDLLEGESKTMSDLPNIGEYLRQGITKEAIDNFMGKLELIQALTLGMEETALDPEHQVAYNVQIKQWLNKWKNGEGADNYKTISTENVQSIIQDTNLLLNKLEFAKTLIETNTESKLASNTKTQQKMNDILVDIVKKAGDLKIDGISVLPPIDELNKLKTSVEQVALIEHTLHTKVKELIKKGSKVDSILDQLYTGFNVNKDSILSSWLTSWGLNSDIKALSPYDFFVWLTSAVAVDNYDFLYNYKQILSKEQYKQVPLFLQEYAAKTLYSFAKDYNNIHREAVKWLYKDNPSDAPQEGSNIFFINGIAGSGKTSAVISLVAAMLNSDNYWIASPNQNQANKLKDSLSSLLSVSDSIPVYDKTNLLKAILTDEGYNALQESIENPEKEESWYKLIDANSSGQKAVRIEFDPKYIKKLKLEEVPKVIFIDEVTHFNLLELRALDQFARQYGTKIITAGDTLQKGALIDKRPCNIGDIFTWKSPAMLVSVRSANIHKKDNTDKLQSILRTIEEVTNAEGYNLSNPKIANLLSKQKELNYYQTDSDLQGDKIVDSISVEDLKVMKKAAEGKTLAIIAKVDGNGEIADKRFKTLLKDADITDYVLYSPDDSSKFAVQGAEADYVIINDMPPASADNYQNLISFYTYATRSLNGSLIKVGSYRKSLNLAGNKVNYTSNYSLPGLEKQKELKGDKIKEIDSIIKDHKPEEPKKESTGTSSTTTSNPNPTPKTPLSDSEKAEIDSIMQEGEENVKTPIEIQNISTWVPDSLYGYGFYNRLGITKKENGYIATDNGSSTDMDGLFEKGKVVSKRAITGFIKFKNLISLYDSESEEYRNGIKDPDILYFLWKINPAISDSKIEDDRMLDTIDWIEHHMIVDNNSYIIAKKYDSKIDSSAQTVEGNDNAIKDKSLWLGFAKHIRATDNDGNIIIDQYITIGALPKQETLDSHNIKFDSYTDLQAKVTKDLETRNIAIYQVNGSFNPRENLRFQKASKPDVFVSLRSMKQDYGINFIEQDGRPVVYLINGNEKSTVNGITSFSFLHFIASTEKIDLPYEERIKKLESFYVKDGKLTVSGKYFTLASFDSTGSDKYKRVLILEPQGYSYRQAIDFQQNLVHQIESKTDVDGKQTILERKASAMSQYSQIRLLRNLFETLGCIDENGLAQGNGVLPYVQYTLNYIRQHLPSNKAATSLLTISETFQNLIDQYKNAGRDFDMEFISDLIDQTRYGGILLLDSHLSVTNTGLRARLLPEADTSSKRDTRDMNFDLDETSYREFLAGYTKGSFTIGDTEYKPSTVEINDAEMNNIGLSGHYLQMPRFSISEEALKTATLIDTKVAKIAVDRTNDKNDTEKESTKVTPTTASFKELAKSFDPENDIIYSIPPKKGFYKYVRMDKEEAAKRRKYFVWANGFHIRIGDTVQIYGDTTHTYRISFIGKGKSGIYLKYDQKDGKDFSSSTDSYIPVKAISQIVGREVNSYVLSEKYDYYRSERWKDKVLKQKAEGKKSNIIMPITNIDKEKIQKMFPKDGAILYYPVFNSDESVLSRLNEADTTLQEGLDLTDVQISATMSIDELMKKIQGLSELPDINGIVLVSLTSTSFGEFGNNRKELLSKITEGYIKGYIAISDNPKLIEKPDNKKKSPKKSEEKIKEEKEPKEKKESNEKKEKPKKESKPNIEEDIRYKDSVEIALSSGQEFEADSEEDAKQFSTKKWIVLPKENGKFNVIPKLDLVENKDSIPNHAELVIGQKIDIKRNYPKTGSYQAILKEITDSEYHFEYQGQGDQTYTQKINKDEFNYLFGKKYSIIDNSGNIESESDSKKPEPKKPESKEKPKSEPISDIDYLNQLELPNLIIQKHAGEDTNSLNRLRDMYRAYANLCYYAVQNNRILKNDIIIDYQLPENSSDLDIAKLIFEVLNEDDVNIMEENLNYIRENLFYCRINNLDEIGELYDEFLDRKYDC